MKFQVFIDDEFLDRELTAGEYYAVQAFVKRYAEQLAAAVSQQGGPIFDHLEDDEAIEPDFVWTTEVNGDGWHISLVDGSSGMMYYEGHAPEAKYPTIEQAFAHWNDAGESNPDFPDSN